MSPEMVKPKLDAMKPNRVWIFVLLKWAVIVGAILLALYFGTHPVRSRLSDSHLKAGDKHLLEGKYLSAHLEYDKALILFSNADAKSRKQLAKTAAGDITVLEQFFAENDAKDKLKLLHSANLVPSNEMDAVVFSKRLIEQEEYQLAAIPAKTAVLMDKSYRDAWLYLGISNLKAAKHLELTESARSEYLAKAKEALTTARELDPTYEPVEDYLKALNT